MHTIYKLVRQLLLSEVVCVVYASSMGYFWLANENLAYNSLFCRYWQFALGALIHQIPSKLANYLSSQSVNSIVTLLIGVTIFMPEMFGKCFGLSVRAKALLIAHLFALCLGRPRDPSDSVPDIPAANKFLECQFLLFIGDISYSLYLWHWPLLSLYDYTYCLEDRVFRLFFLFVFSVFVAALSRRILEQKLIDTVNLKYLLVLVAAIYGILMGIIYFIESTNGFESRIPTDILRLYSEK